MSLGSGQLLASAVRTASVSSNDIDAADARGVQVIVNVTADPAAAETIAVQVEGKDPVSGNYFPITAFAAVADTVTPSTEIYTLYPAILETGTVANSQISSAPVPRTFRVKVTHSASGSWTYSVAYSLLP